ncbi:MAG: S41 family peptidase [Pseudomonadota bacterium]
MIPARLLTTVFTLCVLTVASLSSADEPNTAAPASAWLSTAQIQRDVALAKETYERVHPGYLRYATADDMHDRWQQIIDVAVEKEGLSVGQFYLMLSKTLTAIRCDHTKAELPTALRDDRNATPVYFPAQIDLIERRGFIRRAPVGSPLKPNDEIMRIDGRTLSDWLDAVEPYIPMDGYTPWARNAGLTASLEFMGGALDHFGALLFDIQPVASVQIKRMDAESGKSGKLITLDVPRITHKEWLALGLDSGVGYLDVPTQTAANFKDGVHVRIHNTTAYLRVDTFVNYRDPVEPDAILNPVFTRLKAAGVSTLVLDLRRNGGGSTDAKNRLLAYLLPKTVRPVREKRVKTLDLDGLREHLWTWDKRALNPNPLGFRKNDDGTYTLRAFVSDDLDKVKPAKDAFNGSIIALTSNANSSGSTNLLAILKEHTDVTLVGERTGGSAEGPTAGLLFTLTLPESQIKARVPFFRQFNNVESFEQGLGLSPDVLAHQTVDDYLNGRDTVLLKAMSLAQP